VASSNSSLTTKFCACAYIEFLAGICFWPVGNTYTKQYNTEDAKNFQASSAIQMHNQCSSGQASLECLANVIGLRFTVTAYFIAILPQKHKHAIIIRIFTSKCPVHPYICAGYLTETITLTDNPDSKKQRIGCH
jgi:hypothetical protein